MCTSIKYPGGPVTTHIMIEFAAFVRFDTVATCGSTEGTVTLWTSAEEKDVIPITSKWSITASV